MAIAKACGVLDTATKEARTREHQLPVSGQSTSRTRQVNKNTYTPTRLRDFQRRADVRYSSHIFIAIRYKYDNASHINYFRQSFYRIGRCSIADPLQGVHRIIPYALTDALTTSFKNIMRISRRPSRSCLITCISALYCAFRSSYSPRTRFMPSNCSRRACLERARVAFWKNINLTDYV